MTYRQPMCRSRPCRAFGQAQGKQVINLPYELTKQSAVGANEINKTTIWVAKHRDLKGGLYATQ
jgi:hypothetical protein